MIGFNMNQGRATFSDWALTASAVLPTAWTKLSFTGAVLVNETESLFDATNSRILKMREGTVGKAALSLIVDTTTGTNHWVETALRGYDANDTLLFTKRGSTTTLVKNNANDVLRDDPEFYFGANVEYFEIWIRASSAMPYTNPAITVVKL